MHAYGSFQFRGFFLLMEKILLTHIDCFHAIYFYSTSCICLLKTFLWWDPDPMPIQCFYYAPVLICIKCVFRPFLNLQSGYSNSRFYCELTGRANVHRMRFSPHLPFLFVFLQIKLYFFFSSVWIISFSINEAYNCVFLTALH